MSAKQKQGYYFMEESIVNPQRQFKALLRKYVGLFKEQRQSILQLFRPVFLSKNKYLFTEGNVFSYLFVINPGVFKVYSAAKQGNINKELSNFNSFGVGLANFQTLKFRHEAPLSSGRINIYCTSLAYPFNSFADFECRYQKSKKSNHYNHPLLLTHVS